MKKVNSGILLESLLAVLISAASLLTMNPFGIAYFTAASMFDGGRYFLTVCAIAGLFFSFTFKIAFKYVCVIVGILIVELVLGKRLKTVAFWKISIISGVFTLLSGIIYTCIQRSFVDEQVVSLLIIHILEALAVFCLTFIFKMAVSVIRCKNRSENLNNQEQLSVALLIAIAIYSMNSIGLGNYSLPETIGFFSILFIGYRYGCGASTIVASGIGIVIASGRNDAALIGYMCLFGIIAGAFREYGRIAQASILVAVVSIFYYLKVDYWMQIATVRGFFACVIVYLLIPEQYMERIEIRNNSESIVSIFETESVIKKQLGDFARTFRNLSQTFSASVHPEVELKKEDVEDVFDEVTQNLCAKCSRCNYCWESEYEETSQQTMEILNYCSRYGVMENAYVPMPFKHRCINLNQFLNDTSRSVELAKMNMNWRNRLMESRLAIAGQFSEVARLLDGFSDTLGSVDDEEDNQSEVIRRKLERRKMKIKQISIVSKKNAPKHVYIHGKMKHGRYVTSKEICDILKDTLHCEFMLGRDCRMLVSKNPRTYEFIEQPKYAIEKGSAAYIKNGEDISGDTYTVLSLENGQLLMSLSDGMGSGGKASEESEYIVQMIEMLLDSGFGKKQTIRLVNSLMFLRTDQNTYSTVDVSLIDLHCGICEIIKVGAAASFLKKKDGSTQIFDSESLPLGAFTEVDYESKTVSLEDGDMIIMVSDGIIHSMNSSDGDQMNENDILAAFISEYESANPQEMAEAVLNYAKNKTGFAKDDMTVLTGLFYEKYH